MLAPKFFSVALVRPLIISCTDSFLYVIVGDSASVSKVVDRDRGVIVEVQFPGPLSILTQDYVVGLIVRFDRKRVLDTLIDLWL